MINTILDFLENTIKMLERFRKNIENFLSKVLNFFEETYNWIVRFTINVKNYLIRIFKLIGKTIIAFLKLSLYYVPSLFFIFLFSINGSVIWIIIAVVWFLVITILGIGSRRRNKNGGRHTEV